MSMQAFLAYMIALAQQHVPGVRSVFGLVEHGQRSLEV